MFCYLCTAVSCCQNYFYTAVPSVQRTLAISTALFGALAGTYSITRVVLILFSTKVLVKELKTSLLKKFEVKYSKLS